MRRCGQKRFVWYVQVCDYEACWPIAFFDSEDKAGTHCDNYVLRGFEQSKIVVKAEVF